MQTNRNLVFSLLLTLMFLGGTIHPQSPEESAAASAWRSIESAKGGRDRLLRINNWLVEYGTITRVEVFPDKGWQFGYHLDGKTPDLTVSSVGKISYCVTRGRDLVETRDVTRQTNAFRERLALLLETRYDQPRPIRVRREGSGKNRLDVIETEISSSRIDFAYEPEEMLVREVRFFDSNGKVWHTYLLSDYVKIDGIQMPRTFANKSDMPHYGLSTGPPIPLKVTFNIDYNPTIFDLPCKATTPDAWKRKP